MRVLISGAGIAGSTLTWFLAKAGATVVVVEKSRAILPHGQNVDLKGSAVTAIKKMGLLEKVKQSHTNEKGTQFIDASGRPFALFPQTGFSASPTSPFEILRGDLAALLYNAAKDHINVTYLFESSVKEIITNDDKSVKVMLSNGEMEEFDLIVAADGQWSKLRKENFASESIKVLDQGMYAVYWTVPRLPMDNDWWNVYIALCSRIITIRPDPHGTIRAMFTFMPSNDTEKKLWADASKSGRKIQHDLLSKEFADAGWQTPRLLESMEKAEDFYFQDVQQIRMSKWSNNRIICLGDAAYAPTPLKGGGTTLAITGAYILAGELSKLGLDDHPSKALEAYEKVFRPFIETSQEIPFFIPGIAHPETTWKRWILQGFVWSMSKIVSLPWIRHEPGEDDNDGFPLPFYPTLDEKINQKSLTG
jgi:2-polyprenyl-6-methoxyphenol hydroxylase-like FAD-dependent oxidoreductase